MSRPAHPPPDDPGLLFGAIADQLWALRVVAEIGERQAALGDLVGLNYSLRQITARTRFAVASAADLSDLAQRQAPLLARDDKTFRTSENAP